MIRDMKPEQTATQPSLTTLLVGFSSSHSMSRVGSSPTQNWWWQGSVALSPTTLFISVWAHAVSTASKTVRRESDITLDQHKGITLVPSPGGISTVWKGARCADLLALLDAFKTWSFYMK